MHKHGIVVMGCIKGCVVEQASQQGQLKYHLRHREANAGPCAQPAGALTGNAVTDQLVLLAVDCTLPYVLLRSHAGPLLV